jgi:hypothetical protein
MAAEVAALRNALSNAQNTLADVVASYPSFAAARAPPPRPGGSQLNPSAVFLSVREFLRALRACQTGLFGAQN